jgi:hypothetical protein
MVASDPPRDDLVHDVEIVCTAIRSIGFSHGNTHFHIVLPALKTSLVHGVLSDGPDHQGLKKTVTDALHQATVFG